MTATLATLSHIGVVTDITADGGHGAADQNKKL